MFQKWLMNKGMHTMESRRLYRYEQVHKLQTMVAIAVGPPPSIAKNSEPLELAYAIIGALESLRLLSALHHKHMVGLTHNTKIIIMPIGCGRSKQNQFM